MGPKHFMFLAAFSTLYLCLSLHSLSFSFIVSRWSFYPFSQSQAPFRGLFGEKEMEALPDDGNIGQEHLTLT